MNHGNNICFLWFFFQKKKITSGVPTLLYIYLQPTFYDFHLIKQI